MNKIAFWVTFALTILGVLVLPETISAIPNNIAVWRGWFGMVDRELLLVLLLAAALARLAWLDSRSWLPGIWHKARGIDPAAGVENQAKGALKISLETAPNEFKLENVENKFWLGYFPVRFENMSDQFICFQIEELSLTVESDPNKIGVEPIDEIFYIYPGKFDTRHIGPYRLPDEIGQGKFLALVKYGPSQYQLNNNLRVEANIDMSWRNRTPDEKGIFVARFAIKKQQHY